MALNQVGLERLNTATTKKIGKNKNIIINGAMQVAQRGISSTTSGYGSVDRWNNFHNGTNEAPEQRQANLGSGDTGPYEQGFRKALKITNGNQTGGAGAGDYIAMQHNIEAQNLATSGWNYTSASSFVTLQFWIKSSVAQSFKGYLRTTDGTKQVYPFDTGSLSADTWTKITKTVPGNSNIQIDNDNGGGFQVNIVAFWGTDGTASSVTENAWQAYSDSTRMKDNTSTWYTTNDATLEITGVQLETGSVATDFEHKSFGEDLQLCSRYYQKQLSGTMKAVASAFAYNTTYGNFTPHYPMGPMRTAPSLDQTNGDNYYEINGGLDHGDHLDGAFVIEHGTETTCNIYFDPDGALNNGYGFYVRSDNASAYLAYSAEL